MVILHIENKSAPLRGQKIINLPQNRAMKNFHISNKNGKMCPKNIKNLFFKNMEIFENSSHDFGADLLFSVRAMGQIYFQFEE